jgi:hypothetical protein
MDLNALKAQLDTTESQLGQYTANLPSEIETQIQNAYTPALQNSLNTTKDMMGDYLGRYFDTTTMGPGMAGTTAMDLSPTQKLGVMGRELGTMSGELQATQRFSDYLGGQMKDMYGKALQAAQMGQQNLADQYNRQFQQYQLAWQEAENAKARAAASTGGGWRPDPNNYLTTDETKVPRQEDLLKSVQQVANAIAAQRGKTGGTYTYGGQNFGDINQAYKMLFDSARNNYNLNLNPQWLWQQLGNNIGNMSVPALLR